jgi:hypothetical protein
MSNDVKIDVSVWLRDPGKQPQNTITFKNVIFGFKEHEKLPSGIVLDPNGTIDISKAVSSFDIKFLLKTKKLCDEHGNSCTDFGVTFKPVVVIPPFQTSARQLMWIAPGEGPPIGEWPSSQGFSNFKHKIEANEVSMSVSVNRKELPEEIYSYSLAVLVADTNVGSIGALVRDDPQIKNGTTLNRTDPHFFPPYLLSGLLLGTLVGILGATVVVLVRARLR